MNAVDVSRKCAAKVWWSFTRQFLLALVLSLGLALPAVESTHASYSTQGRFSVNTEGGPLIAREDVPSTQLDISDSDTSVGGVGNTASAGYAVSITNAAVSASASAQNALSVPGNFWSASASVDHVGLIDDLRFTIPAGDYPAGLYVMARMHVEGSVAVSGVGATARHIYSIFFGSGAVIDITDAPAAPVSTDIEFTAELAAPGTTFNSPVTLLRRFNMGVESHASAPGEVAQAGSSSIAVNVTCLVVPPGVTWVADSGAFGAPDCSAIDSDADGVPDGLDNCTFASNADQRDSNGDGHGNVCDFDYTNNCVTNFLDLAVFSTAFGAVTGDANFDDDVDFDGNGVINFLDFGVAPDNFATFFTHPPGPSASACVPAP